MKAALADWLNGIADNFGYALLLFFAGELFATILFRIVY